MNPTPQYRKATPDDFEGILRLQHKNLLPNLNEDDLSDGFLTIEYTKEQLHSINSEFGIYVACHGKEVIGYMMAQSIGFAVTSPLIAQLLSRLTEIQFEGVPISTRKSLFYGPVCIEKERRGQKILEGLFNTLLQALRSQREVGLAFVSERNPRSFKAHNNKLGMQVIDESIYNGQKYLTLAFPIEQEGRA